MRNIRLSMAAGAAALAMGLSACGGGGQTGSTPEATQSQASNTTLQADWNPQPYDNIADGGTLTTAITEINPQMNVWHGDMTLYTSQLWKWYNPVTVTYEPDGTWAPDPDYFTDVSAEEKDGKTVVTYTINDQAVWNDGSPIEWTAIEAGWKACGGSEEYSCNSTDGYNQIESVKQGDNAKVAVVTFKTVFPWWKGLFNNLLNPEAVGPDVFDQGYLNNPHPEWGAGPYKVEKIDANAGVASFVPNEKWWGDKGKLERRVFQQMEPSASINAFKNGQVDATGVSSEDRLAQVKDLPNIEIRRGQDPSIALLELNADSGALGDISVRQAVFSAVDREVIKQVVFKGLDYTEEPLGSLLIFPFQQGYEDNAGAAVTFDKAKSAELLDAAGWTAGSDGIREKDGTKLSLNLPVFGDSVTAKNRALALQSLLKDVGVDVVVKETPSADFAKVVPSKDWDLLILGFSSSDPFGAAYTAQIWASDSTLNLSGTGTPELDAQLKELAALPTEEEQIAKANEIEKLGFQQYGLLPLYQGPSIVATKPGLANFNDAASVFAQPRIEDIGWQK